MTVIRWLIARLACAQSLLIWSAAITRAAAPRATSLPGRRRIPAIVPGAGGEARFRAEPCPPAQSARRDARKRGVLDCASPAQLALGLGWPLPLARPPELLGLPFELTVERVWLSVCCTRSRAVWIALNAWGLVTLPCRRASWASCDWMAYSSRPSC